VDLNPLAVELCKVALWLEAHSPGEPLNFLDHHIKCGNAIVGFVRREELDAGRARRGLCLRCRVTIKAVAKLLRERNKEPNASSAEQTGANWPRALQQQLDGGAAPLARGVGAA
jgi:hypothetical protein